MKRMIKAIFIVMLAHSVFANLAVEDALDRVIATSACLSERNIAGRISNWGVPQELFKEACFTNLVAIMQREHEDCEFEYINGLTGVVKRAVFVAALTRCGELVYHDSLVRWFGQSSIPVTANIVVWDSFLFPIATDMEEYVDMNFDDPGVCMVLNNIKKLYHDSNNAIGEEMIERIQSGESKSFKLKGLESGLIKRIKAGNPKEEYAKPGLLSRIRSYLRSRIIFWK